VAKVGGEFSTQSNRDFDASLQQRDSRWGYRNVEDLEEEARKAGLFMEETSPHQMPANNLVLHFKKR
jgi:hypothetical protein